MSITDIVGTDNHVGEIIPSTDDDNSAKAAEDQSQEEGSDEKQQNQNWITTNKPTLLSQGTATDETHSLESSEDYALHYLTRSVVKMMDNIGFSTCHESVLNILTDLCKRYMQRLWIDSKVFAEHAGRRYPIFEDANMAFGKLMFSAAELHAFMMQVQHDPLENSVPLFPIRKSSINLLSIYGPVSDKELAERPEHIPRYFPAMHPEWCSDQGVRAADILMKSVAQIQAKNNKCIPRARVTKPRISFPDFSGSTAKELGFVRPQKLPARKVAEEPSGISSSANKTTGPATNSATRTKLRKWPMHEPTSSSKHCDRHHVKAENSNEKDTPNKPFSQRSIGMFGMPPSALVHPESVAIEKMKRKKKRDRDRDKDRTKERKERHRDKDKNEENPGTSSAIPVAAESYINEKAIMNASCSTDAKSDGQAKKSANRQQDVLSSEHQQIERDVINLENNVTTEKSLIEEENVDKLKHDHSVDLRLNDDHSTNDAGLQMSQILVPQHSSNSAGDVEDGIRNGGNAIEKAKEGMKDGAQQNDKKDPNRSTVVEIAKGNLEKRKTGEKGCERKKVARKAVVENSLSVVIDDIAKNSTTLPQDIKALKVVLSRPTGQKIFTALSPSSGTERAVKEVEQKCDSGSVHGAESITPSSVDEPQIAESICEKKKHRKEKDRDKHHSKEHKRKDKEKYKEHKKSKTKDKEKKYIKLRPEKFCLKRPGEHILRDEIPAPKIPKLKIRFGSNLSGVNASPSVSTTSTILTSSLSSDQLSERNIPSSVDQNIQIMQSANKLEDREMTNPLHTSLKSDVNIKPRKRQPVTKAELKALPKLPLKARTCGTKEGSRLTGGQGPAGRAVSPLISQADIEFEQRDVQQPMGKRLRMDNGKKDLLGSCFDPHGAVAFNPTEKVFKAVEKERNSESHVQGMMPKYWGRLAPRDIFSTFLTDERRQVKESLKRKFERFKKKPGQVNIEAESDSIKPKLGKRIHLSVGVLIFDREKLFIRDRSSEKLKCKELEKEKRKERHHSMEKVKENGREKGSHHVQKAPEKEKDQTKRDEKGLEIVNEKKGAQQNRQKEKGNDGRKKKGSGEGEKGKGKGKKIEMVGMRSGDIYLNSCGAENDKKHLEKVENVGGSEERRKRNSVEKDEEYRKGAEKVAKKYSKETRCSSETKERAKHHDRKTAVEEKVKSRDKDFRDKEKRKKHSSDWGGEHSIGKSSKEVEKAPSGKDEDSGDLSNLKTNSGKDELTGNDTNNSYLPYDAVQKTDRVIPAKEQLSKRSSADSDVFGSRSSTTDSLTKSSDKKSATLDSDDSLDTMWICPECSVAYVEGATDMVGCDACDNWFHWNCVGLLVAPPDDAPWYCQNCAKKKLKKKGGLKSSTSKKGKK